MARPRRPNGAGAKRGTIACVMWFWVIVLVAIIGAVAVLASGKGDAMRQVYDDRPDSTIAAGRSLTADDLTDIAFSTGLRGYRMDEVDALIDRVRADLLEREGAQGARRESSLDPGLVESGLAEPGLVEPGLAEAGLVDPSPSAGDDSTRQADPCVDHNLDDSNPRDR